MDAETAVDENTRLQKHKGPFLNTFQRAKTLRLVATHTCVPEQLAVPHPEDHSRPLHDMRRSCRGQCPISLLKLRSNHCGY
jgi:hypothetical protein